MKTTGSWVLQVKEGTTAEEFAALLEKYELVCSFTFTFADRLYLVKAKADSFVDSEKLAKDPLVKIVAGDSVPLEWKGKPITTECQATHCKNQIDNADFTCPKCGPHGNGKCFERGKIDWQANQKCLKLHPKDEFYCHSCGSWWTGTALTRAKTKDVNLRNKGNAVPERVLSSSEKIIALSSAEGRTFGWDIRISCSGQTSRCRAYFDIFATGPKGTVVVEKKTTFDEAVDTLWQEVQKLERQ